MILKRFDSVYFGLFILIQLNISCQDNSNNFNYEQEEVIDYLYGNIKERGLNVALDYGRDSIVRRAYMISEDGDEYGRMTFFRPDGTLRKIEFVNKDGEKVGDESFFNEAGRVNKHLFWKDSTNLLFYSKFSPDGTLDSLDGSPWLISGDLEVEEGDTASYYIAVPSIPYYETRVSFGVVGEEGSQVHYKDENDLRAYTYNKIMNNRGVKNLRLKVSIEDSAGHEIFNDSLTFQCEVYSSTEE